MPEAPDAPLPPGGEPLREVAWDPWSPADVAARLESLDVPWAFAAGWALDLHRGRVSRPHEDIEIAVPAASFPALQAALAPLEFEVVGGGRRWPVTNTAALGVLHQTWLRDEAGVYRLDVFREPHQGTTWMCRRDPGIRRPYSTVVRRTAGGLPYQAPEIVLLFKAKWDRPKDRLDLRGTLPLLDQDARRWLAEALEKVHPGHPWLELVAAPRG